MKIWKAALVAPVLLFALSNGGTVVAGKAKANNGQFHNLPGRWKGGGSVKFDSGTKETVRCIATYFIRSGGARLQQNLRCSTLSSYKISARSELTVRGNRLSGTWVERNSGNDGTVSGHMTPAGFRLSVTGEVFTARLQVTMTGRCKQSIRISPVGLGVKRININLRRC